MEIRVVQIFIQKVLLRGSLLIIRHFKTDCQIVMPMWWQVGIEQGEEGIFSIRVMKRKRNQRKKNMNATTKIHAASMDIYLSYSV